MGLASLWATYILEIGVRLSFKDILSILMENGPEKRSILICSEPVGAEGENKRPRLEREVPSQRDVLAAFLMLLMTHTPLLRQGNLT